MNGKDNYFKIVESIGVDTKLIVVSKTQSIDKILEYYAIGQRRFGENKVQELLTKFEILPKDIEWHFIGHLQTNKVKMILPIVTLIHSVDSISLLDEIQKQAKKLDQKTSILLQVFIAKEETKYGFEEAELKAILEDDFKQKYPNIEVRGLMGMATNTSNQNQINDEFGKIHHLFNLIKSTNQFSEFKELSIGMSGDYQLAIKNGASLIRVGSLLFQ